MKIVALALQETFVDHISIVWHIVVEAFLLTYIISSTAWIGLPSLVRKVSPYLTLLGRKCLAKKVSEYDDATVQ